MEFHGILNSTGQSLGSFLGPQSRSDMLSWSRYESGQYSLDWQAGILFELEGMSKEADALAMGATIGLFEMVRSRLLAEMVSVVE